MHKEIKTLVRCSVGDTEQFTVKVGLHQGSTLSPYLFDLVMDVIAVSVTEAPPSSMMFVEDITVRENTGEEVKRTLEAWRRVLAERGQR